MMYAAQNMNDEKDTHDDTHPLRHTHTHTHDVTHVGSQTWKHSISEGTETNKQCSAPLFSA